jgi:hypothetical protein
MSFRHLEFWGVNSDGVSRSFVAWNSIFNLVYLASQSAILITIYPLFINTPSFLLFVICNCRMLLVTCPRYLFGTVHLATSAWTSYLPFPAPSPSLSFLSLTFPTETELGCSFTLRPSWQISYKRDFRVLCSIDVSQLIKILLSQGPSPGIAHIRTPFQKSFLPLPRCISAHISQAYCMHA